MIGYRLLVAHIFTLANLCTDSVSRRQTSKHNMALDPTRRGSIASLSEEEAMATYYNMERDHAQRDDERANGIYMRNSHRGYHRVDSRQSACKYPHSLPRRA